MQQFLEGIQLSLEENVDPKMIIASGRIFYRNFLPFKEHNYTVTLFYATWFDHVLNNMQIICGVFCIILEQFPKHTST